MEKTVIALFTATGNTLSLAKRIEGAEIVDITKINEQRAELPEDTARLGILSPVYMGGLPLPVRVFIREYLSQRDNSDLKYIFSLLTCGSGGKSAEWMIDRELQDIGLSVSYTSSLRYPDAYLPLKKNLPSEEETERIVRENEEKIEKILKDLENEEISLPYKPLFGKIMKKLSDKTSFSAPDKRMSVSTQCTACGVCSSVCPMDNILIKDGKANIGERCISCFACYHRCPENAISFQGRSGQYKGLVTTEELKKR